MPLIGPQSRPCRPLRIGARSRLPIPGWCTGPTAAPTGAWSTPATSPSGAAAPGGGTCAITPPPSSISPRASRKEKRAAWNEEVRDWFIAKDGERELKVRIVGHVCTTPRKDTRGALYLSPLFFSSSSSSSFSSSHPARGNLPV